MRDGTEKDHYSERLNHQFRERESGADLEPGFCGKKECSVQQMFVDSEVLRRCSPRVPFQTGMLEKSGKLGTDVGSGEVDYIAPYAAMQYYGTADTRPYDANRGAHWFERTKVAEKEDILRGADKI